MRAPGELLDEATNEANVMKRAACCNHQTAVQANAPLRRFWYIRYCRMPITSVPSQFSIFVLTSLAADDIRTVACTGSLFFSVFV